jgi:hypothetical protein
MSTDVDHIALANRFQASVDFMLGNVDQCAEWITVAAFYKALHLVEAAFYNDRNVRHTYNHADRLEVLKKNRRYSPLFTRYNALWSASTIARYLHDHSSGDHYCRFADFMPHDQIRPLLLDRYLPPFERMILPFLANSGSVVAYQATAPPIPAGIAAIAPSAQVASRATP